MLKKFLGLLASVVVALTIASCGGGNSGSAAPTATGDNGAPAATPWIRYSGSWRGYLARTPTSAAQPATLTLSALTGQTGISANSVARVEVQVDQATPAVLTAANSTDATGRAQYLFDLGLPGCTASVHITVTDVTGFAYTKNIVPCAQELEFGAFSDYGSTSAQVSYQASAPISLLASRTSPTGYADQFMSRSQTSMSAPFPSADGDMLMLIPNRNVPVPDGIQVTTRIDAGGGTFTESTVPFATIECCGPRPASDSSVDILLSVHAQVNNIAYPPEATYTYKFSITDPATGTLIGSQSDTIIGDAFFPLKVKRGQAIEMEVTPHDPRITVSTAARLGPAGALSVQALSTVVGTPARFKVFCCTP